LYPLLEYILIIYYSLVSIIIIGIYSTRFPKSRIYNIVITGLPGAGKTTLCNILVHDDICENDNTDYTLGSISNKT
jgi:GTPase SAR1 family protein